MTPLFVLPLAVAALVLAGCDSRSAEIGAAQQKLDQALSVFAIAQQGYAPVANGQPRDLQAYRQEQLASIVDELEQVIATGSQDQKKTASRLLAAVHLSAARYATRNALSQFATLSAQTPILDGALSAAERSSAQAQAADVDYDAALAQLAADSSTLQKLQDELRQQAGTLQEQIAQLTGEQQSINAQAQAAMARSRAAQEAAFIADGDAQSSQQEIAADTAREAAKHSAEAEKRQVEIDQRQRRLDVIQAQLDTVTAQIADLKAQADATRKLQADTQAAVAAAGKVVSEQAAALKGEFDARAAEYAQVSGLFQSAASRADKAVELLAAADAEERLSGLMDQAYVNTERALAGGAWASVTGMVATIAEQVALPEAGTYRDAQKAVTAEVAAADEAAGAAIAAAREEAAAIGDTAAAQAAILNGYAERLGK